MSKGKITSYTVVPQKSVMEKFINDIKQKRQEEMGRRQRLFLQQAQSLKENAQKYLIENARKELNELHNKLKEFGLEDSIIVDDKSGNSDAYFQFLLLQIGDAKSKLGQAYTQKMNSDLYSLGSSRVSGAILKASDVLKQSEGPSVKNSIVLSQNYALLRDQREQVTKEIEDFQNNTGSVFNKAMLGLIEQFNRSTELSSATILALSIRAEINKEYDVIRNEEAKARELYQELRSLGADDEYTLLQMLLEVQKGKARLDRATVEAIEDKIREIKEKAVQQASTILIAGLKELGYEVRGIEDSLFTQGGEFYFRNSGDNAWKEDYYVQGSVEPKNKKMIFKMGKKSSSSHTKEEDRDVEKQFCSEIGELQRKLEKHNLKILIDEVTEAGAGEVVVLDTEKINQLKLNTNIDTRDNNTHRKANHNKKEHFNKIAGDIR